MWEGEGGRGSDEVLQNIVTSGDLIKIVLFSRLFIVFHKAVTEITWQNIFNNRNILNVIFYHFLLPRGSDWSVIRVNISGCKGWDGYHSSTPYQSWDVQHSNTVTLPPKVEMSTTVTLPRNFQREEMKLFQLRLVSHYWSDNWWW